ncbi:hypothetical protein RFI_28009 [Reticulomyxa filosa]|uniref:Uncharacterized protein n=1 Tax=Reticulomyxa filosa TaxID=46433 RepID=X6M7F5_RETFI|nr:hypothetical protein RFI_28009 [Reticulomyxa filosa]|eukprot:ETO09367.1 hypothetical protein RFI_28009 [Reticulomyxa filosa]
MKSYHHSRNSYFEAEALIQATHKTLDLEAVDNPLTKPIVHWFGKWFPEIKDVHKQMVTCRLVVEFNFPSKNVNRISKLTNCDGAILHVARSLPPAQNDRQEERNKKTPSYVNARQRKKERKKERRDLVCLWNRFSQQSQRGHNNGKESMEYEKHRSDSEHGFNRHGSKYPTSRRGTGSNSYNNNSNNNNNNNNNNGIRVLSPSPRSLSPLPPFSSPGPARGGDDRKIREKTDNASRGQHQHQHQHQHRQEGSRNTVRCPRPECGGVMKLRRFESRASKNTPLCNGGNCRSVFCEGADVFLCLRKDHHNSSSVVMLCRTCAMNQSKPSSSSSLSSRALQEQKDAEMARSLFAEEEEANQNYDYDDDHDDDLVYVRTANRVDARGSDNREPGRNAGNNVVIADHDHNDANRSFFFF